MIPAPGGDQVVMPASHCVYAYDPATGTELWKVKYKGFSNVPRPVFAHGLVYVQTGFAPPEILAIRPDGKGDVTATKVVWRFKKGVPNVPSPIIVGDNLFMVADNGIATCLDAKTGAAKWTQRIAGGNYSSSLIAHDKAIYATSDDGKTTVFEAADEYKEIARSELAAGKVQASFAVAETGALFLRDRRGRTSSRIRVEVAAISASGHLQRELAGRPAAERRRGDHVSARRRRRHRELDGRGQPSTSTATREDPRPFER